MTPAEELTDAVRRLSGQVSHWTPSRWAASSATSGVSRADLVHDLVQWLADRAADAEGRPRRVVPRLPVDTALADQLTVLAGDLAASGAPAGQLREAADRVHTTQQSLSRS